MAKWSGRAPRPTLEEVGDLAGVSRATVSRVINNSPRVSPEVRASVERAIAKLGYSPNQAARSLVTRRADAIALVVCEPEAAVLLRSVLRRGRPRDRRRSGRGRQEPGADGDAGDEERERARRYLRPEHVDGVVLMSLHGDDPLPRQLQRRRCPDGSRRPAARALVAAVRRRRQPRRCAPGRRAPARRSAAGRSRRSPAR